MSEILVGVDGTAHAEDPLAFAERLAAGSGATLRLAMAYPYEEWPSRAASHEYGAFLRREAEAALDNFTAEGPRHAIADPSPARALQALAEQTGAALIVVGSTRRGALGRVMPGSTAERLLHGSPCPVAIVPRGHRAAPVRAIGVGYDGSDESEATLDAAAALARRLNATLRVIRVFDTSQLAAPAIAFGAGVSLQQDLEAMQRADLDRKVAAFDGAEAAFVTGRPGRELAEQSEDVDLMIVGSRGYGPLRAVLLGGVSHVLVHQAACPVIVLPRGARGGVETLFGPAAETAVSG